MKTKSILVSGDIFELFFFPYVFPTLSLLLDSSVAMVSRGVGSSYIREKKNHEMNANVRGNWQYLFYNPVWFINKELSTSGFHGATQEKVIKLGVHLEINS